MSSSLKFNDPLSRLQRLQDSHSLLSHLVEQTSDILTASDLDFKPVTWNKAAEMVFGLKSEQVINRDIREFLDIDYGAGNTKESVRKSVEQWGEWRGEAHFTRPTDGRQVTILISFKQLKDHESKPIGYLVSGTDITERKITEQILKESENRFREMADSAPVMIWMSDVNNKITYVNKTWLRLTGVDLVKIQSVGWVDLVHKDDVVIAKKKFDKHFSMELPVVITYRLRQYDGSYRWVQETGIPRKLSDGTFIGFIGSVVDIHDQKLKEEQLRYQASILENVSDIIIVTDVKRNIERWNKAAEEYFCIPAKEAIGKNLYDLIPFRYTNTTKEQMLADLNRTGTWKGEKSFVNAKGETFYVLNTCKFIYQGEDKKPSLLSVSRDITERKKAEQSLLQSEQFYRSLIADSANGTILSDPSGTITFTSHAIKTILGYEEKETIGRNLFEFVHPDDIAWAMESFQKEIIQSPEVKSIVVRLLKKSGEWLWCMVRGHNLLDNPYVRSFVVYFHDDTARKKANDALKESEKLFRSLISDIQIGVLLLDHEGRILLCNSAISNMFLVKEEDVIGRKLHEISSDVIREDGIHYKDEDRPTFRAMQTGKAIKDVVLGVYRPAKNDRIWVMINSDPILDENGKVVHIISSVKDITERKRIQEEQIGNQKQITQATIEGQEKERTEIGKELHDNIGQQLTTIKLFLDMAKTTANNDSTNEMISMALKGVSDVINEIRSISRSLVPSTLRDLGLIESIHELIDSFERTQTFKIKFKPINIDEEKLPENLQLTIFRIIQEQLTNIIKYASARDVFIRLKNYRNHIELEIEDNGVGFDPNNLKKGLGFTNIQNRAELFGGQVTISALPGKGCTVNISFPLAKLS